ncbi:MAG: alpha/beta fold hydrolase, partial [Pseudomonadota bacterium]
MSAPDADIHYARVGDINIAYRWDGLSDGPVVMMAHAMGTSHRLWDWQLSALASRFRVLRYDWRGHGNTDAPPGPYSLPQFEQDAVGLMDALGLERVHWVGISTGGMIGQGLGINHGARVASLALCNTTSLASEWYKEWVKERQAVVKSSGPSFEFVGGRSTVYTGIALPSTRVLIVIRERWPWMVLRT